jgi:GNAT superfamily N-acetyltransferase
VTEGADGGVLRVMTSSDVADGLRLSAAAGWNQREEDWRFLLDRNPGRFVVALRDGRVIATGGAACYGSALAWVCMILVDPAERGHGVGTRVVSGVLDRLADMRVVGLDATPHGQGVYARLGFVEGSRVVRLEAPAVGAARSSGNGGPGSAAGDDPTSFRRTDVAHTRVMEPPDLERVLDVDARVFGASRADLLRWASRQAPALCRVDDAGAIAGYCFGRPGTRARQIGPVVARDAATAQALVSASLSIDRAVPVFLDAADRADWLERLAGLGFTVQRPLVRMFRGKGPIGVPERQWAIFGPEFG